MDKKIFYEKSVMPEKMKADCSKCSGLCCTALFFSKSDGFPEDKADGKPCVNLTNQYKCKIHRELEKKGMRGCIGYDCFGAGQYVTQVIYQGKTWREIPSQAKEIFRVFVIVFRLHQMRYFLFETMRLIPAKELMDNIQNMIIKNEEMCNEKPENIVKVDIETYQNEVNYLLKQVCSLLNTYLGIGNLKNGSTFLGRNFKGKDMSGYDFNMQLLIASNFAGCCFSGATFLGTDTRDADFSDADLRDAIFLSQGQINAAKGNRRTKIPKQIDYPVTWK